MAFQGRDEKAEVNTPPEIQEGFTKALRFQVTAKYWTDLFEPEKERIVALAKKAAEDNLIDMKVGEGYQLENGMMIPSSRTKIDYHIQQIYDYVVAQKIPMVNFLSCIKDLDLEKVKTLCGAAGDANAALPDAYKAVQGQIFFVFKPEAKFVATVRAEIRQQEELREAAEEAAEAAKEKPKAKKKKAA